MTNQTTDTKSVIEQLVGALEHGVKWLNICDKPRECMPLHAALTAGREALAGVLVDAVHASNDTAMALAQEWHGQAGGRLAPQLTENEIAGMLAQFATDPTKDWPQWMKDSSHAKSASFPKSTHTQASEPLSHLKTEVSQHPAPDQQHARKRSCAPVCMRFGRQGLAHPQNASNKLPLPMALHAVFLVLAQRFKLPGMNSARP